MYLLIIWIIVAVVFAVIEGATEGLVAIWFVAGSVAAALTAVFTSDILTQILVFILVSTAALILTRPLVKKVESKKHVSTNADMAVGKIGIVLEPINNLNNTGRVSVLGLDWAAVSKDGKEIPKGCEILVEEIQGVKLIVSPYTKTN